MPKSICWALPLLLLPFFAPWSALAAPETVTTSSAAYTNSLIYQRTLWASQQRTYPLGYVPADARIDALTALAVADKERGRDAQGTLGNFWVNIGPGPLLGGQIGTSSGYRPMSGRIKSIAVDPANTNHWLAGAAGGGVWATSDTGSNWSARTDDQATLAMGAIAFAPSDPKTIFAGTGTSGFTSECGAGLGLLKSTNSGVTWQLLASGALGNLSFCRLRVSPTNAVLAFTSDLNQAYRVERNGSVNSATWTNIGDTFLGIGGILTTNDPLQPGPASIYRIRRL